MFDALFLYHPITNLNTITSNPNKPGSLISMSNLDLIVESQSFNSDSPVAKQIDISNFTGYVVVFSSQGVEVSRNTLKPYNNKLKTTFSLEPDRYIIRLFIQMQPQFFLKLYMQYIKNNYLLLLQSSDAFRIIKDINISINSSSPITLRIIINISEVLISRVEIFNYYNGISNNYAVRLVYSYYSYGELYKDLLFLLNLPPVFSNQTYRNTILITVLSNADEKPAADNRSFVNTFTINSNAVPLWFLYRVIKIAWFIEGGA